MDLFQFNPKSGEGELWLGRGAVSALQQAAGLERKVTELFDLLRDPIYRYLSGRLGDRAEAEDLTQEVFLRLYTSLQKGQAVGNVRAWVFRVAHNLAIDQFRRQGAWPAEGATDWEKIAGEWPDPAPSAEARVAEREQHEQ
ncbi:MAG: RNA polymerase sigma factor, partial [Burkholderiales bacterium]